MADWWFSGLLIANPISDFENWPIQDGGTKMADWKLGDVELNRVEIVNRRFLGLLIANLIINFENWIIHHGGSKMADWIIGIIE